jgi:hypothetical protein
MIATILKQRADGQQGKTRMIDLFIADIGSMDKN